MVDFELTEEQLQMQKLCRDFAKKEIKPLAKEIDRMPDPHKAFPVDLFRKSFELGIQKAVIPTQYGGLGLDCLTHVIMWEELAAGDAGFCVTYEGHVTALAYMLNGSTEEQKHRFLPALTEGEGGLIAIAVTEPNTGPGWLFTHPDTVVMQTRAKLDGDNYVLNGNKTFCTNGETPLTKWLIITAQTDTEKTGIESMSHFLVEAGTPGLSCPRMEDKMGQRMSPTCELLIEDMRVPKSNLLGGITGGSHTQFGLNNKRVVTLDPFATIGGLCLGIARSAFEAALDYSKQRIIVHKPSIQYQLVGAKLANMFIEIDAARAMAWKAARYTDAHDQADGKLGYGTKIYCSEVATRCSSEAMQIFGGIGYTKDTEVEKLYRDARVTQIYEGANDILRMNIAQRLEWGI